MHANAALSLTQNRQSPAYDNAHKRAATIPQSGRDSNNPLERFPYEFGKHIACG
jgi:hypothetical protein